MVWPLGRLPKSPEHSATVVDHQRVRLFHYALTGVGGLAAAGAAAHIFIPPMSPPGPFAPIGAMGRKASTLPAFSRVRVIGNLPPTLRASFNSVNMMCNPSG